MQWFLRVSQIEQIDLVHSGNLLMEFESRAELMR
jgi:hypothetical protein